MKDACVYSSLNDFFPRCVLRVHRVNIWATAQENLSSGVQTTEGADQSAHPRSLISAFVIRLLENFISKLATSEISMLVSVAEQAGLSLVLSGTPKTGFLASRPILWLIKY